MARGSQSGRKNNNPEGHNQYSGGLMERVRNHPIASAAAAGGAVAAGMFLWSKRDRIGDQMNNMSDKVGQWNESRKSQSPSGSGSTSSGSSTDMRSGKRSSETGSERIGSGAIAGASAASSSGSGRSTGGRSGSAQTGQNMSPSRTASETVSY